MTDRLRLYRTLLCTVVLLLCGQGAPAALRADVNPPEELDVTHVDPEMPVEALVFLDEPNAGLLSGELPIPQRIEFYRNRAYAMQDDLLAEFSAANPGAIEVLDRYWLLNVLRVLGKPKDLKKLAKKKAVRKVSRGGQIRLIGPDQGGSVWPDDVVLPWNLADVDAPACWADGFDGDGVIVGHLDTGMDPNHPALAGKFAGYWLDAVKGQPEPYDDHGHGTHTLGTLLGGDGLGPDPHDVGVAPGARWVGAKVLDEEGVGSYAQCLAGLEFMAELKAHLDLRVICGSWSLDDEGRDVLADACRTLLDLEILPVFAVGNDGPAASSTDVPASYPSVLGVGALDETGLPAGFSARGPAPIAAPWFQSPAQPLIPAWSGHKPDLSAPGVRILSSQPGGGYAYMTGTSAAAPHVAGAVALLLDKNASLTVRELAAALTASARGVPGAAVVPGNVSGYGHLNIHAALESITSDLPVTGKSRPLGSSQLSLSPGPDGVVIRYALGTPARARLDVYDLTGRRVRTLAVPLTAGHGMAVWRGRDAAERPVSSGVYLVRLWDGEQALVRKTAWVR